MTSLIRTYFLSNQHFKINCDVVLINGTNWVNHLNMESKQHLAIEKTNENESLEDILTSEEIISTYQSLSAKLER